MTIKPRLGFDDSLDVFGIHGIGGLIGSVLTAVTMLPALGGPGGADYALGGQLWIQVKSVAVAVAWSAVGSAIAFTIARAVRSEEHTSELQSLMRISYAVFCLKKKKNKNRRQ